MSARSSVFAELGRPLSSQERAIAARLVDRERANLRAVKRGDSRNCIGCGNAGDIKGDPRRGFCLVHRCMVSSGLVCDSFTPVHWSQRTP